MSEINTYQKENPIFSLNGVDVDPKFKDGEVWLSASHIAKLFNKNSSTVHKHLKELEKRLEKHVSAKVAFFATTAEKCVSGHQHAKYYNIDYLIRIGYIFNGEVADAFQDWATSTLKREIHEQANPHLTLERGIDRLKDKGESDEKIENRVKGKLSRRSCTDEIKERASVNDIGYTTNKGYLGMTGKDAKGLRVAMSIGAKASILDNMTPTQLAINNVKNLLEVDLMRKRDARGRKECGECCYDAGKKVSALWEETLELNEIE